MSFIRPEATATIRRWLEPGLLGILAAVMLWAGLSRLVRGELFGIGVTLMGGILAVMAATAAIRRLASRRGTGDGPGVVTVEEGRIAYMGPEEGGVVAVDALVSVEIVTRWLGAEGRQVTWILADEFGQRLSIPGSAVDTERLFDALSILDGISYQAVVDSIFSPEDGRFMVWRRPPPPGASGAPRLE